MTDLGCEICGAAKEPGKRICGNCFKGIGRTRATCQTCGQANRWLDHELRCRRCRDNSTRRCADCQSTSSGLFTWNEVRLCAPCALRRELDRTIPAEPGGALVRLRPVILAAEPVTTRRWLRRAHDLLTGLDQEHISLDHTTLDGLPHPKSVEHLRALLIATDILPADPAGPIRRLQTRLEHLPASLEQTDRRVVSRWVRWQVLPPLRQQAEQARQLGTSVTNARRRVEQTVAFLTVLQDQGRSLAETTQDDIDQWFARPGAARWNARPFLAWSQQHRHLPAQLELPAQRHGNPTAPADPEHRWTIAARLGSDDQLDPADRVAGLLVVLYAQPLSRIATLTRDDVLILEDRVHLQLGPDPLELTEPLASLIRTLPLARRRSTAQQLPNHWLFPGGHAGKHIEATTLGARLKRIGIEPRRMRLAAAEQLSRDVPPAMLAGILGLRIATVAQHVSRSGGNWANYAATRQP